MTRKRNFIKQTEGATAIIIACSLFAIIAVASLSIDMGHLYTVRNELQNVADAAALAGVAQLIQDQGGLAVWNSTLATQTAIDVAQAQRKLQFPDEQAVANGARDDLTILFGTWNDIADPSLAWAPTTVNPNAIRVTITRGMGTIYGPVTSIFAKAIGSSSSTVVANATAYLGYTTQAAPQVPLALPSAILQASNGRAGWFASLLGPREAVATTTKTLTFKDTGGGNVTASVPTSPVANLDPNQGYWFTAKSTDSVPTTITDTLKTIYTPSSTVRLGELTVGKQIYPRSEYCWGRAYIGPIFQELQKAYNYKTTGNVSTAPAAGTAWRTTMVVHGPLSTASLPQKTGFMSLARLLVPFGVSEAFACATVTYPTIKVSTFVNADITGVKYNSSTSDDGGYSYPKTIATPVPTIPNPIAGKPITTYNDKKDFLTRFPNSTWNLNTVTIKNLTDASTVSPPGSLSGGPPSHTVNPNAPINVGAYSRTARLVK